MSFSPPSPPSPDFGFDPFAAHLLSPTADGASGAELQHSGYWGRTFYFTVSDRAGGGVNFQCTCLGHSAWSDRARCTRTLQSSTFAKARLRAKVWALSAWTAQSKHEHQQNPVPDSDDELPDDATSNAELQRLCYPRVSVKCMVFSQVVI